VDLFGALGKAFAVGTEAEFEALAAATGTIASYFAFADSIAAWLARHGIPQAQARDYIARIFSGLAGTVMAAPERSFSSFATNHATPGGINEQMLAYLVGHGVFDAVSEGLDTAMERITRGSQ
jgi:pyrroline-5-carboxylate reductase